MHCASGLTVSGASRPIDRHYSKPTMGILMKKLIAAMLLMSAGVASAAEIAGNVTLASDYRFRGISQLEGEISPAIQGGFDLETESGFYIGTWASNVNFTFDDDSGGGAIELDVYAGFAGSFSDDFEYDLGYLYYAYPNDQEYDLDYYEFYGSLSAFGGTVGINYSPDYFAETGKFYYVYGDYGLPLGESLSLDLHVALNSFDEESFLSNGEDQYIDYSIGLSASYFGADWSVAWVGTDLDEDDYFGYGDLVDDYVVVSVSKSL